MEQELGAPSTRGPLDFVYPAYLIATSDANKTKMLRSRPKL